MPINSHDSTLNRRTILKGAAWSIPVIALATAAPRAVASGGVDCSEPITVTRSGWTVTSGALATEGSTGWTPAGTADSITAGWIPGSWAVNNEGFLSMDNSLNGAATVVVSHMFEAVAGRLYDVRFDARVGLGSDNTEAHRQVVDVTVGGVSVKKIAVEHGAGYPPAWVGGQSDADLAAAGYAVQPVNGQAAVSYQAPTPYAATANGPVIINYTFSVSSRAAAAWLTNDDIWLSAPTVEDRGCTS